MVLLTTFCTHCLPAGVILPVTKFLTFEASQWVRNVDCDFKSDIADFYVLRDRGLFECHYENIGVTRAVLHCDDFYSQSMSSLHLITPLQEFSDLCGVTVTGRSIVDFSLLI